MITPLITPFLSNIRVSTTRSAIGREFFSPTEELKQTEQIDLPEISQSYQVSFSEQALANAAIPLKDSAQGPSNPMIQPSGLAMYQQISGF